MILYLISTVLFTLSFYTIYRIRGSFEATTYVLIPFLVSTIDVFIDGNQTNFRLLASVIYSATIILMLLYKAPRT